MIQQQILYYNDVWYFGTFIGISCAFLVDYGSTMAYGSRHHVV